MQYLSTKELSEKWGINRSRVLRLAREGRIESARLFGGSWMFPVDAKKPADARTRAVKAAGEKSFFRFPLYVNFEEKDYSPPLTDGERMLRKAQLLFHAFRFEEAKSLLLPLEKSENRYIRISALYHRLYIAIYDNSPEYDGIQSRMKLELSQDFSYKNEMLMLRYGFDADNTYYGSILEEFSVDPEYEYHPSAYYVMLLVSFIPIQNGDFSLMSRLRYDTYELLCRQMEREGHFLEAQKLHYLLSAMYQLQNNELKTNYHIRRGLELAAEHGLYFSAALYAGWFPVRTRRVLTDFPSDFAEKVQSQANTLRESWSRFDDKHRKNTYISILSGREYEYAYLANQGLTNREVAQKHGVSEKTVSKVYREIYEKLGVKNKRELVELINSTHAGVN